MTKQEKNLLGIFGMLVIAVVVLIGVNKYIREKEILTIKRDRLKAEAEMAQKSHQVHDLLAEEKEWLEEIAPQTIDYSKATIEFEKFVTTSSKNYGFDVQFAKVLDPIDGWRKFRRIQINTQADITQKQLLDWLIELHQPEKLRAVTSLEIFPDKKNKEILKCKILVEQSIVVGESNAE